MIPKIIHQTTPTKTLSWEERRMIRRMRSVLSDWEYRLWDDADNERLVVQHFPRYLSRYRSIQRGVVRADIARCMYLYVFGGFYFDTDYKIIAPIDAQTMGAPCVLPISRGSLTDLPSLRLGNAVMGSEPNHPFWGDFLASLFSSDNLESLAENRIEKTTGPEGLTDFFVENRTKYTDIALPARDVFHPRLTAGNLFYDARKETVGAHLCWGSWRTKHIPRLARNICTRKLTALCA